MVIVVWDNAPCHRPKIHRDIPGLIVLFLPPYSPELNPAEQIWNVLRRDYFANKVFDSLSAATLQAEKGLANMASNREALKSLTNWPWIGAILKAK